MAEHARLALAADRRSSKRFQIEQEITFRVLVGQPGCGTGRTVDFSRRGVLFRTSHPLQVGDRLEMSVHWPALLFGSCPLKLVAQGQVLRAGDGHIFATIGHYDFRTRRTREWPA